MAISVLYDGWALAYQPNSPAALHLHTLLSFLPEEIQAQLALPAESALALPPGAEVHLQATGKPGHAAQSDSARLYWEQYTLPRLTRRLGAQLVHRVGSAPALFGAPNNLLSPCRPGGWPLIPAELPRKSGLGTRMREAVAEGSLGRLRGLFWPEDLPVPDGSMPIVSLPRLVHPAFADSPFRQAPDDSAGKDERPRIESELPETYILYHGPSAVGDLRRLLDAWSWAAGSIGEYYPLLTVGLDMDSQRALAGLLQEYRLGESVRALPPLSPEELAAVYRGCSALFHPAPDSPWDGALQLALTCEKPIVAQETRWADALVGPAGYMIPVDASGHVQARALGAALISVVVEENLADNLSQAAAHRSAHWASVEQTQRFRERILSAYSSFAAQQTRRK